jgi:hypothetical protein
MSNDPIVQELSLKYNVTVNDEYASISPGWRHIVEDLIIGLQRLGWNGEVDCIKEKFGELRFYTSGTTQKMDHLIEEATEISRKTCDKCGGEGIQCTIY